MNTRYDTWIYYLESNRHEAWAITAETKTKKIKSKVKTI